MFNVGSHVYVIIHIAIPSQMEHKNFSTSIGTDKIINCKYKSSQIHVHIIPITSINYKIFHLLNINVKFHRRASFKDSAMKPRAKENKSITVFELHILKYVTYLPTYTYRF